MSIVTPSYNQGRFIEESIRSVLLQGHPDVELIVVDGGSTDETPEILERYSTWLAYWVSEPDQGASHAVNKGLAHATGDLIATLACDDVYLPYAFRRFAEAHLARPGALVFGDVENCNFDGTRVTRSEVGRQFNINFRNAVDPMSGRWQWYPAGLCIPRDVYLATGPTDVSIQYCCDVDWLCRLSQHADSIYVGWPVVRFRIHAAMTSIAHGPAQRREMFQVVQRYWHLIPDLDLPYITAAYLVHDAAFSLAQNVAFAAFWDRARGIRLLLRAFGTCPRIVTFPLFRSLARRAVIPRRWLRSNPWRPRSPSASA